MSKAPARRPKKKQAIISRPRRNGKLRPKDEAFCQAVASGMSGAAAYRAHIAQGRITAGSAQQLAYMMGKRVDISLRIAHLKEMNARTIEERLGVGREYAVRELVEVWETPIDEIGSGHRFCQEKTVTETEHGTIVKLKSVSKMDAMEKLAKMAGWYPGQGNGAGGALVPITINIGGMYSPEPMSAAVPALGQGMPEPRTLEGQCVRVDELGD